MTVQYNVTVTEEVFNIGTSAPGPQGPQGPIGETGADSTVPGPEGPQGIEGPQGSPGVSLVLIDSVPTFGDLPASAAAGEGWIVEADGDVYFYGQSGWTSSGQIMGPQGQQGIQGIQGNQGPAGIDGNTILYDTVDPTTEGVNGNFFLNTSTKTLFGPKAGGVWPAGTSLIGPQGPQGIQGEQGLTGASTTAQTVTKTTASLAHNAYETGTVVLSKSYAISKIQTDRACRVRMYADSTTRDADISRAAGTAPTGDHGLFLDVVSTADHLTWWVTPAAIGRCATSAVPITITNLSGSTAAVQVILTSLSLEA